MSVDARWIVLNLINEYKYSLDDSITVGIVIDEFLVKVEGIEYKSSAMSKPLKYKQHVFDLLKKNKNKELSESDLYKLQEEIELHTIQFDENSILYSANTMVKMMIIDNQPNARDYLKSELFNEGDVKLVSVFGVYTLEALIIYVLSSLYNTGDLNPLIRAATLIDKLESCVRQQASAYIKFSNRSEKEKIEFKAGIRKRRSKMEAKYPIGSELLKFMIQRKLITLKLTKDGKENVRIEKKNGAYYIPAGVFACCNFDLSLLPIKLSLPMICKPLDWRHNIKGKGKDIGLGPEFLSDDLKEYDIKPGPKYLSDLTGGYLCAPSFEYNFHRYSVMTTTDISNFYIVLKYDYDKLCNVMNKLQNQPYRINSQFLKLINERYNEFVNLGLLMPKKLARMNLFKVTELLREIYVSNKKIQKIISYSELLVILSKFIQRASYENFILELASAYDGYDFYLPAFLDFRGRIYRSGVLHFHERDLARSLIVFADQRCDNNIDIIEKRNILPVVGTFHYASFKSFDSAVKFMLENNIPKDYLSVMGKNVSDEEVSDLIRIGEKAKNPFQFLATLYGFLTYGENEVLGIPITQDASASAYQIISYFLLNEKMGMSTNLFPSLDYDIHDIYTYFYNELMKYIPNEMKDQKHLASVFCEGLSRKIVKGIFMPLIYGKTLISTCEDLVKEYRGLLTRKDSIIIGRVIYKYWKTKCKNIECLVRLIRNIGWFASKCNIPVIYDMPYLSTVQDYHNMKNEYIWIYDTVLCKRRKITLRVASEFRNSRKTLTSTFVNFIHQQDAYIAMKVVEKMNELGAPVYTVHDNFITTMKYSEHLPVIYGSVINEMGPPIGIINRFIAMNIRSPNVDWQDSKYFINPNSILPDKELHSLLIETMPSDISKSEKKTWENRIMEIMDAYKEYIHTVCGDLPENASASMRWECHLKKWKHFQSNLQESPSDHPWYCLHY